jgi:hypothetical protein
MGKGTGVQDLKGMRDRKRSGVGASLATIFVQYKNAQLKLAHAGIESLIREYAQASIWLCAKTSGFEVIVFD